MIRLVTDRPSPPTTQRLTRMLADARALKQLTRPECRAAYSEIEALRDLLSSLLDRADDKHA